MTLTILGYEYRPVVIPVPAPPSPPPPPRSRKEETEIDIFTGRGETEIDIYKSKERERERTPRHAPPPSTREFYDDDTIFERDRLRVQQSSRSAPRRRSTSNVRRERAETRSNDSSEADYYNRRAEERAYMGEAYNGATKDWSIVDVPPGTERVAMEGIGGGGQEITWEKYNGVRRSKFIPEREREREREVAPPPREREREKEGGWDRERVEEKEVIKYSEREETTDRRVGRPISQRQRMGDMWTEITKDLVVREAIEECGYDYEETEYFFYVIQYLRYVSRFRFKYTASLQFR